MFTQAKYTIYLFLAFAVALTALARAERWDDDNNPKYIADDYEYQLDKLPAHSKLEFTPWSDTYWPHKQGGINLRWNRARPSGFYYATHSLEQLKQMTKEEIASLSPAEKYDIFMGHYDYPLQIEVSRHVHTNDQYWVGLCDGWSIASLQFAEPKPTEVKNADGIVVSFGSSDIKALLSYSAAHDYPFQSAVGQAGRVCTAGERAYNRPGCGNDINPGALHVILTNELGSKKRGVVVDSDPWTEIWNQPVYAFDYEVVGSAKPEDGVSGVEVKATLTYADELDEPLWNPVLNTPQFRSTKMEMSYTLDIDAAGKIIGGRYLTANHPDNLWIPLAKHQFTGDLGGINQLLK